ncbi:NADH-quinone oxidoreductase subunit H, partial [Akkermansia sp.]
GWSIGFGLDGWLNEHVANWVAVICQLIAYVLKLLFFVFFFVWVRWTLPRFRYDQVMKLGWMVFFELAVINIFITAAILYFVK